MNLLNASWGKDFKGVLVGKVNHRQVTILSLAAWNEAQQEIGQQMDPIFRRANLLVDDINFENTKGNILTIGDLKIELTGETKPCVQRWKNSMKVCATL